jgi:hypothetical protein
MLLRTLAIVLLLSSCTFAWSYKEHIQITRIAAQRIIDDPKSPDDLRRWLQANVKTLGSMDAELTFLLQTPVGRNPDPKLYTGLLWWVCVPDIEAEKKDGPLIAPFQQRERVMHFIDLELFLDAKAEKSYRHDLSGKPALDKISRDPTDERFVQAGYLPFATERAFNELVAAIRQNRLAPRDASDTNHAVRWAGYLAHYAQDATQPQHATMDYKSASYFPRVQNPPNVHAAMEWQLVDDPAQPLTQLRTDYFEAVQNVLIFTIDASDMPDVWESTIRTSHNAYDALPLIGTAAQSAAVTAADGTVTLNLEAFYRYEGKVRDMPMKVYQMKAMQTALAILRTERLLKQAWAEARK